METARKVGRASAIVAGILHPDAPWLEGADGDNGRRMLPAVADTPHCQATCSTEGTVVLQVEQGKQDKPKWH